MNHFDPSHIQTMGSHPSFTSDATVDSSPDQLHRARESTNQEAPSGTSSTQSQPQHSSSQSSQQSLSQQSLSHQSLLRQKIKRHHLDVTFSSAATGMSTHKTAKLRQFIENSLAAESIHYLYIDDQEAFDRMLTSVTLDANQTPKIEPGPLKNRMLSGGVIILNEAQFNDKELEALNELKMEGRFKGEPVSDQLRIVSIIDSDKHEAGTRSPALISRASYIEVPVKVLPNVELPTIEALGPATAGEIVIDGVLQNDWRSICEDRVVLKQQGWMKQRSALSIALKQGHSVLLRNMPYKNYYFQQALQRWTSQFQQANLTLRLDVGVEPQALKAALANKRPGHMLLTVAENPQHWSKLWTVNQANVELFYSDDRYEIVGQIGHAGHVVPLSPILEKEQHQPPLLYITETLTKQQWHQLMRSDYPCYVAAAPGVQVPEHFSKQVYALQQERAKMRPGETLGVQNLYPGPQTERTLLSHWASVLITEDAAFTLSSETFSAFSSTAFHYYVTPDMDVSHFVQRLTFQLGAEGQLTGEVNNAQCLQDLLQGHPVIIHGLECNPQLQRALQTLVEPPHYLYSNGQRIDFNPASNRCQLLLVLPNPASAAQFKRAPQWQDTRVQAIEPLKHQLSKTFAADLVERMFDMSLHAVRFGLYQPKAIYQLDQLQRWLETASKGDSTHLQLLKDQVAGEFREQPERYALAKAIVKAHWGKAGQTERTVDRSRLQAVYQRVIDPKLSHQREAILFQALNTFSPAVIREVLTISLKAEDAQPSAGSEREAAAKKIITRFIKKFEKGAFPDILDLNVNDNNVNYAEPKALDHRTMKMHQKIAAVFQEHRAVFLKSSAGLGKTHTIEVIAEALNGVVASEPPNPGPSQPCLIDVSQAGSQELHNALEQWLQHPHSDAGRLLVIDEANLAPQGTLELLNELFVQGSLTVNGRRYPLSADHKILFTGNYDHFAGRHASQVARHHFATITLKPFTHAYLKTVFVEPVLQGILSNKLANKLSNEFYNQWSTQLAEQLLEGHQRLSQAFSEAHFSVRTLEELTAQVAVNVDKALKRGSDVTFESGVTFAEMGLSNMAPILVEAFRDVYLQRLPTEASQTVQQWLSAFYEADENQLVNNDETSVAENVIDDGRLIITPSTQDFAVHLNRWLTTQEERVALNFKAPKTLGQRGYLVEGPAGRGKDEVVNAVLKQRGTPSTNITWVNAGADLQDFTTRVRNAAREGHTLVISEMNLLPSNLLEQTLNGLLTGHDPITHPDFRLIATVNPSSYSGREPLSAALLNRMVVNRIGEYPQEELMQIALGLAERIHIVPSEGSFLLAQYQHQHQQHQHQHAGQHAGQHAIQPAMKLPSSKVTALATRHHALVTVANQAKLSAPTTRQLKSAVESMGVDPMASIDAVMQEHYLYYLSQQKKLTRQGANRIKGGSEQNLSAAGVGVGGGASSDIGSGEGESLSAIRKKSQQAIKAQLTLRLTLEKPEWVNPPTVEIFPEFTEQNRSSGVDPSTVMFYNRAENRIDINWRQALQSTENPFTDTVQVQASALLVKALSLLLIDPSLRLPVTTALLQGGGLSGASLQPFMSNQDAASVRHDQIENNGQAPTSDIDPSHAQDLSHPQPPSTDPSSDRVRPHFSPDALPSSGVGDHSDPKEPLGRVEHSSLTRLRFAVHTLDNQAVPLGSDDQRTAINANGKRGRVHSVGQVTLIGASSGHKSTPVDPLSHVKEPLVKRFLLTGHDAFPDDIVIDRSPIAAHRERGGWSVEAPRDAAITYQLYASHSSTSHQSSQHASQKRPPLSAHPSQLIISQHAALSKAVDALQSEWVQQQTLAAEIVDELVEFFKHRQNFTYDIDCEEDYQHCHSPIERANQFLTTRHGVCYEYAHALGFLLEQVFQIPARLVSGHLIKSAEISPIAHVWVEWFDPETYSWVEVDPTGSVDPPGVQQGEGVEEGVGRTVAVGMADDPAFQTPGTSSRRVLMLPKCPIKGGQPWQLPYSNIASFKQLFEKRIQALGWYKSSYSAQERYTTNPQGRLDIQRVLQQEAACFKVQTLEERPVQRKVYFYQHVNKGDWQNLGRKSRIPVILFNAIDQLLRHGLTLHVVNQEQSAYAMDSAYALNDWSFLYPEANRSAIGSLTKVTIDPGSYRDDLHLDTAEKTHEFFENLMRAYFEALCECEYHHQSRARAEFVKFAEPAARKTQATLDDTVSTSPKKLRVTGQAANQLMQNPVLALEPLGVTSDFRKEVLYGLLIQISPQADSLLPIDIPTADEQGSLTLTKEDVSQLKAVPALNIASLEQQCSDLQLLYERTKEMQPFVFRSCLLLRLTRTYKPTESQLTKALLAYLTLLETSEPEEWSPRLKRMMRYWGNNFEVLKRMASNPKRMSPARAGYILHCFLTNDLFDGQLFKSERAKLQDPALKAQALQALTQSAKASQPRREITQILLSQYKKAGRYQSQSQEAKAKVRTMR